jgi:hypothetical protein
MVLLIVLPLTEKIPARRMYITESMLEHMKFPFLPLSTVPGWIVSTYSLLAPSLIVIAHGHWTGQAVTTMHAGVLGSLTSTLLAGDITNLFKTQVWPSSTDIARPWLSLAEASMLDWIFVSCDLCIIYTASNATLASCRPAALAPTSSIAAFQMEGKSGPLWT